MKNVPNSKASKIDPGRSKERANHAGANHSGPFARLNLEMQSRNSAENGRETAVSALQGVGRG